MDTQLTLTFFPHLNVLVFKQVCKGTRKKEQNISKVIGWIYKHWWWRRFYLRHGHQTGTMSISGVHRYIVWEIPDTHEARQRNTSWYYSQCFIESQSCVREKTPSFNSKVLRIRTWHYLVFTRSKIRQIKPQRNSNTWPTVLHCVVTYLIKAKRRNVWKTEYILN